MLLKIPAAHPVLPTGVPLKVVETFFEAHLVRALSYAQSAHYSSVAERMRAVIRGALEKASHLGAARHNYGFDFASGTPGAESAWRWSAVSPDGAFAPSVRGKSLVVYADTRRHAFTSEYHCYAQ
jgi:hypothetical protein